MSGFKDFFIPRETAFFEHLKAQVYLLNLATHKLTILSKTHTKQQFKTAQVSLKNLIVKGDALFLLVTQELHQTFITPIDREEIQTLSFNLNRVLHGLKTIFIYSDIYRTPKMNIVLKPQIHLLQESVEALVEIFENPLSVKKNQAAIAHIKLVEDKADHVLHDALIRLFDSSLKPIDVMKRKELLIIIEETIDKTEFVANIVQNVLINHS